MPIKSYETMKRRGNIIFTRQVIVVTPRKKKKTWIPRSIWNAIKQFR